MAEGEGFAPFLSSFDNRSTEGFEPFWKFAESTFTSPSSIPLYERTHPTTILRQIGREHSNPPKLGARIDLSVEASLDRSPVTLQMDTRVGFATFGAVNQRGHRSTLQISHFWEARSSNPKCKSRALPLTDDGRHQLGEGLVNCMHCCEQSPGISVVPRTP